MSSRAKLVSVVGAVTLVVAFAVVGCDSRQDGANPQSQQPALVREPAVAGLFYPKDPQELSRTIDTLLASVQPASVSGELKALICPHAGYPYSGLTAAFGYKVLAGRDVKTVFLLAGSHYAAFQGVSVCAADIYRTPLGDVKISDKSKTLAKMPPFMLEPKLSPITQIQRPNWFTQSSHATPLVGDDTPETWEHSGEVEVPFLQKVLKPFELVSTVFGQTDPAAAAQALASQLDDHSLVVVSTDLSHYHPYDQARQLDTRTVTAILAMNPEAVGGEDACGFMPVRTLLHLAKLKGWKPKLLDYRNSGDTSGNKNQGVVGYTAIAFTAPEQESFNKEERKLLLELARRTVKEVVTANRLPVVDPKTLPAKFVEPKGCFVTLTENGALRGCIGHIMPQMPLYQAVIENAQSAATRDHRFQPVRPDELDKLQVEVSVLTVPQPLAFSSPDDLLAKLQPHRDGVVLQVNGRGATYLPQVWEQIPDKVMFLNTLSEKAGCAPDAWRGSGTAVGIYHVEAFKESEK
ncbi:MAG: AmmeMemoRadiSam system protein B [Verrucomicrobia bacterium]|nr:AmmeMemoRadiSam system protein B [Verrucomicrobiota bacterium]